MRVCSHKFAGFTGFSGRKKENKRRRKGKNNYRCASVCVVLLLVKEDLAVALVFCLHLVGRQVLEDRALYPVKTFPPQALPDDRHLILCSPIYSIGCKRIDVTPFQ